MKTDPGAIIAGPGRGITPNELCGRSASDSVNKSQYVPFGWSSKGRLGRVPQSKPENRKLFRMMGGHRRLREDHTRGVCVVCEGALWQHGSRTRPRDPSSSLHPVRHRLGGTGSEGAVLWEERKKWKGGKEHANQLPSKTRQVINDVS